ncbi:hypothetical protein Sta7437_4483 [Stanieria cyanosphaera PCC 7437]|uniref:Uncharacterized protein n=1 Tax=Stanieria cyanosphaera (strain ATCC 29371 / PCC 7437) TaxID=111780 RepID=K9Y1S8_STAC7|nr:hypothetical protein [Stanieria cyanosphaera]AFZ37947.1 hypothetical protein Sta7437_4483 [Stanieria cyanosphaera PCC 7437]
MKTKFFISTLAIPIIICTNIIFNAQSARAINISKPLTSFIVKNTNGITRAATYACLQNEPCKNNLYWVIGGGIAIVLVGSCLKRD